MIAPMTTMATPAASTAVPTYSIAILKPSTRGGVCESGATEDDHGPSHRKSGAARASRASHGDADVRRAALPRKTWSVARPTATRVGSPSMILILGLSALDQEALGRAQFSQP